MASLLLAIIYLAFISLGLPDSLLGAGWPVMYQELGVPISYAGIIAFLVSAGTVFSSLYSDHTTRRFGAGKVTTFSTMLTALAMFGFANSNSFWLLCLWSIPYGLGAGAIDAALNNYVALHYSSKHMNWLHCCWGIGVTISPYIMGACLVGSSGWHGGFHWVAVIQIILTAFMFVTLSMWDKHKAGVADRNATEDSKPVGIMEAIRIPGVKEVLIGFYCYCGLEISAGLWAASYLVLHRGVAESVAARWAAMFFMGITVGRFLSGFISDRLGDRNMIRLGYTLMLIGLLIIMLPIPNVYFSLFALLLIGLGCAPVYPAIIHLTPINFGTHNSQAIIGIQMASAYVGSTLMPPLFGLIAQIAGMVWFPVYLLVLLILMIVMLEWMNRITQPQK